jgi:hypothetical protein
MIPIEWLNELVATRDGYRRLVQDAGNLSVAAWRLAQARCQTWEVPTHVPTVTEVRAAARTIARRAGIDGSVPSNAVLTSECESRGLLVL